MAGAYGVGPISWGLSRGTVQDLEKRGLWEEGQVMQQLDEQEWEAGGIGQARTQELSTLTLLSRLPHPDRRT